MCALENKQTGILGGKQSVSAEEAGGSVSKEDQKCDLPPVCHVPSPAGREWEEKTLEKFKTRES